MTCILDDDHFVLDDGSGDNDDVDERKDCVTDTVLPECAPHTQLKMCMNEAVRRHPQYECDHHQRFPENSFSADFLFLLQEQGRNVHTCYLL